MSEKGGGGEDGGRDESRRDKGARDGDDELAGRPGDLARLLRRGVWLDYIDMSPFLPV